MKGDIISYVKDDLKSPKSLSKRIYLNKNSFIFYARINIFA